MRNDNYSDAPKIYVLVFQSACKLPQAVDSYIAKGPHLEPEVFLRRLVESFMRQTGVRKRITKWVG
jgi:hypothetical protein